ncbi:MAG: hypothetical protein KF687_00695 [Cyclobacteriaceae bacterium]|nr:hypothetical protein [Cyclobacteriaceae bacterium]
MFRIILLFVLIFYVLYKLGLFRIFIAGARQGYENPESINRKPPGSNVNIDNPPPKRKGDFKGGEYVDYEEVK